MLIKIFKHICYLFLIILILFLWLIALSLAANVFGTGRDGAVHGAWADLAPDLTGFEKTVLVEALQGVDCRHIRSPYNETLILETRVTNITLQSCNYTPQSTDLIMPAWGDYDFDGHLQVHAAFKKSLDWSAKTLRVFLSPIYAQSLGATSRVMEPLHWAHALRAIGYTGEVMKFLLVDPQQQQPNACFKDVVRFLGVEDQFQLSYLTSGDMCKFLSLTNAFIAGSLGLQPAHRYHPECQAKMYDPTQHMVLLQRRNKHHGHLSVILPQGSHRSYYNQESYLGVIEMPGVVSYLKGDYVYGSTEVREYSNFFGLALCCLLVLGYSVVNARQSYANAQFNSYKADRTSKPCLGKMQGQTFICHATVKGEQCRRPDCRFRHIKTAQETANSQLSCPNLIRCSNPSCCYKHDNGYKIKANTEQLVKQRLPKNNQVFSETQDVVKGLTFNDNYYTIRPMTLRGQVVQAFIPPSEEQNCAQDSITFGHMLQRFGASSELVYTSLMAMLIQVTDSDNVSFSALFPPVGHPLHDATREIQTRIRTLQVNSYEPAGNNMVDEAISSLREYVCSGVTDNRLVLNSINLAQIDGSETKYITRAVLRRYAHLGMQSPEMAAPMRATVATCIALANKYGIPVYTTRNGPITQPTMVIALTAGNVCHAVLAFPELTIPLRQRFVTMQRIILLPDCPTVFRIWQQLQATTQHYQYRIIQQRLFNPTAVRAITPQNLANLADPPQQWIITDANGKVLTNFTAPLCFGQPLSLQNNARIIIYVDGKYTACHPAVFKIIKQGDTNLPPVLHDMQQDAPREDRQEQPDREPDVNDDAQRPPQHQEQGDAQSEPLRNDQDPFQPAQEPVNAFVDVNDRFAHLNFAGMVQLPFYSFIFSVDAQGRFLEQTIPPFRTSTRSIQHLAARNTVFWHADQRPRLRSRPGEATNYITILYIAIREMINGQAGSVGARWVAEFYDVYVEQGDFRYLYSELLASRLQVGHQIMFRRPLPDYQPPQGPPSDHSDDDEPEEGERHRGGRPEDFNQRHEEPEAEVTDDEEEAPRRFDRDQANEQGGGMPGAGAPGPANNPGGGARGCLHHGASANHCAAFRSPQATCVVYRPTVDFAYRDRVHFNERLQLSKNGDINQALKEELALGNAVIAATVKLPHTHLRFATDVLTTLAVKHIGQNARIFEIASKWHKTLSMLLKSQIRGITLDFEYHANRPSVFEYDDAYNIIHNPERLVHGLDRTKLEGQIIEVFEDPHDAYSPVILCVDAIYYDGVLESILATMSHYQDHNRRVRVYLIYNEVVPTPGCYKYYNQEGECQVFYKPGTRKLYVQNNPRNNDKMYYHPVLPFDYGEQVSQHTKEVVLNGVITIVNFHVQRLQSYLIGDRIQQVLAEVHLGHINYQSTIINVAEQKTLLLNRAWDVSFYMNEVPAKTKTLVDEWLRNKQNAKAFIDINLGEFVNTLNTFVSAIGTEGNDTYEEVNKQTSSLYARWSYYTMLQRTTTTVNSGDLSQDYAQLRYDITKRLRVSTDRYLHRVVSRYIDQGNLRGFYHEDLYAVTEGVRSCITNVMTSFMGNTGESDIVRDEVNIFLNLEYPNGALSLYGQGYLLYREYQEDGHYTWCSTYALHILTWIMLYNGHFGVVVAPWYAETFQFIRVMYMLCVALCQVFFSAEARNQVTQLYALTGYYLVQDFVGGTLSMLAAIIIGNYFLSRYGVLRWWLRNRRKLYKFQGTLDTLTLMVLGSNLRATYLEYVQRLHPYVYLTINKLTQCKDFLNSLVRVGKRVTTNMPSYLHNIDVKNLNLDQINKFYDYIVSRDQRLRQKPGYMAFDQPQFKPVVPMVSLGGLTWAAFCRQLNPPFIPRRNDIQAFVARIQVNDSLYRRAMANVTLLTPIQYLEQLEPLKRRIAEPGYEQFMANSKILKPVYDAICKGDEKQYFRPDDDPKGKSKNRLIMNPSPAVKAIMGYFFHNATIVYNEYSRLRAEGRGRKYGSITYAMNNAEVAVMLEEKLTKFKEPQFLQWDFKSYDSTVNARLKDIDRKFTLHPVMTKMLAIHGFTVEQIKSIHKFIENDCSTLLIRRGRRLTSTKDANLRGAVLSRIKITGTVFSGNPDTGYGNSLRIAEIKEQIAQEAGVMDDYDPNGSGDDTNDILEATAMPRFLNQVRMYFPLADDPANDYARPYLGLVLKQLIVSDYKFTYLSKTGIYMNNQVFFIRDIYRTLVTGNFTAKLTKQLTADKYNSAITSSIATWAADIPGLRHFLQERERLLPHSQKGLSKKLLGRLLGYNTITMSQLTISYDFFAVKLGKLYASLRCGLDFTAIG